jgi:flagellar biosynthesis chaperone FliJ
MKILKPRKRFGDYFSPAEHAFTDFAVRNLSSTLTGTAGRNSHVYDGADSELEDTGPLAHRTFEDDSRLGRYAVDGEGTSARDAVWPGSGLRFLGGDEDFGTGGADEPRQDARREPPREVHPPLRPDTRKKECETLQSLISSLRIVRSDLISQRARARARLERLHEAWLKNEARLQELKDRLSALEYQLRLVDQPYPPTLPPSPLGPIPDIISKGAADQYRRDIRRVRHQIEALKFEIYKQKEEIRAVDQRIDLLESKLREVEGQLVDPERQYRVMCGALEPPMGEWR